jgi:membrane protein
MDLKKERDIIEKRMHAGKLGKAMEFMGRYLKNASEDNLSMIAAGIAFYFLMAAFPALGAAISLYGIVSNPVFVTDQIGQLGHFLPQEALQILMDQAHKIVSASKSTLSFSFLFSILFTIYSATQGTKALITGCNIAYNVSETRNFLKLNLTSFGLTLFLVVYMLVSLSLVAVIPAIVAIIPYAPFAHMISLLRWPFMLFIALSGLAIFYFFAPSRPSRHWQWISPGATSATLLWVVVSALFSAYVSHFGKYNETYGALGGVIILLLWFWLSALTILYGAELNATLEETDRPEKAAEAPKPLQAASA